MDLLEKMRLESDSEHAVFTSYLLLLRKHPDFLFCFIEGKEDKKYYSFRVEMITQRQIEMMPCGGRDGILKLYKLIFSKPDLKGNDIAFFLDKDYGVRIKKKKLYTIPSYSIENQYVFDDSFESLLKNEFNLKSSEDDYAKAIFLYKKCKSEFHKQTLFLNAWLAAYFDKRQIDKSLKRLKIDDGLRGLFTSLIQSDLQGINNIDRIHKKEDLEKIFNLQKTTINKSQIDQRINSLKYRKKDLVFRGKFEFKFFIEFMKKFKNEICKSKPTIFKEKHKCSISFDDATGLTVLNSYAYTPSCLVKFLEQFKSAA